MIRNENDCIKSTEQTTFFKKESHKLNITTVQKSVAYLNKKQCIDSRAAEVARETAVTETKRTAATGTEETAATRTEEIAATGTEETAATGTEETAATGTEETAATGTEETAAIGTEETAVGTKTTETGARGLAAYFSSHFVYHFKLSDWLSKKNLLLENSLFRLQCLLLTLSVVSKLEPEFDKRSIDLHFDIEKLVKKMENDEETLSWEEEKIYSLTKKNVDAFVKQIEKIAKHPEKINKLKKSPTYQRLIKTLQETPTINFKDDEKTSAYLAITSHVIDRSCDPRQCDDFFHLLKAAFYQHLPSQPKRLMESSRTTSNPRSNPAVKVSHNQNDRDSQNESNLPNRSNGLQQYGHFKNNSNHRMETTVPIINIYVNN